MSVMSWARACAAGVTLALLAAPAVAAPMPRDDAPEAFTIAVLPDTQVSAQFATDTLATQTRWLADNAGALNLAFVLHEGDIVNTACDGAQWEHAAAAMGTLSEAGVAFALAPGNHDVIEYDYGVGAPETCVSGEKRYSTAMLDKHFPLSMFAAQPEFGGAYGASSANTYYTFSAGGTKWLVLALQFGPSDAHLAWAKQVAAEHPDHRAIVVTHDLLGPDGALRGASTSASPNALPSIPWMNSGQGIWDKLIAPSANIALTFNGHVADCAGVEETCNVGPTPRGVTGRARLVNDAGNPVDLMVANYQSVRGFEGTRAGDTGLLRLVTFFPADNMVLVRSFSPVTGTYLTGTHNQFLLPAAFGAPRSPAPQAPNPFVDMAGNPFVAEVLAMRRAGVLNGYGDATFRPLGLISREASAAMIYRASPGAQSGTLTCTAHRVHSPFTDVADTNPFCFAIHQLAARKVISGYPDGTFRPTAKVSREAFAAFLFSRAPDPSLVSAFADVAGPLAPAVVRAQAAGVVNGYSDGTFRPTDRITRQAAAAMLSRYYFLIRVPEAGGS